MKKYDVTFPLRDYSKDFRWREVNIWKWNGDGYVMKIHIKIPLTLHTWGVCLRGLPGSIYVNWQDV